MVQAYGPTDGLLAGLALVLGIGASVGILWRLGARMGPPGYVTSAALGMIGAFATGFLLPMWGWNVSGGLVEGTAASAAGAILLNLAARLLWSR